MAWKCKLSAFRVRDLSSDAGATALSLAASPTLAEIDGLAARLDAELVASLRRVAERRDRLVSDLAIAYDASKIRRLGHLARVVRAVHDAANGRSR